VEKLAILKLQGDLVQNGFHVTVEIYQNHDQSTLTPQQKICEQAGYLPPDLQLKNLLQEHWVQRYRELVSPYRKLQPQDVIFVTSKDVQESASQLGENLNRWLRNESFIEINNRLRECLKRDETIQFLIRTDHFDLKKLPWREWSLIRDCYHQSEVAFAPINYHPKTVQKNQQNPLNILAILGHSHGINIQKDRQFLESLSWASVTFLVEPERREINDRLWNHAWDIIFFAGHSETEGEQGKIYINPTESLTVEQLRFALRNAVNQGLKLAIFNSCDGLGLTQKLEELKIPKMIVMRELVPDQVAQEFLKFFLEGLTKNQSLSLAFRTARERLQGLENEFPCASWLPVIYQQSLEIEDTILPSFSYESTAESLPIPLNYALIISLISTLLVIVVRQLGGLEVIELKAFDQLMLLRPQQDQPDPRLLLIEVTEDDIPADQLESISNQNLEKLIQRINQIEQKPAVIGLDIYRTSPINSNQFPDLRQQITNNELFVMICKQGNEEQKDIIPSPDLEFNQLQNRVGFNNLPIDLDGIIRRHIVHQTPWSKDLKKAPCQSEFSFAALIAEKYLKNNNISQSHHSSWDNIQNFDLKLGEGWFQTLQDNIGGGGYQYKQPQGRFMGYQILLNYKPLKSINDIAESLTLSEVIDEDKLTAEQVKNRIILIGTTARLDEDYHRTPYTSDFVNNTPGVIIQAHIISYLLRVAIDGEPSLKWWPGWIEGLWIGVWSISGSLIFWRFHSWIPVGMIIISLGGACYFILLLGYTWVPFVPPLLGLIIATVGIAKANQLYRTSTTS
jgi:CHASE2 domain-containing sensor protein